MNVRLCRPALLACLGVLCLQAAAANQLTPDWLPPLDPPSHISTTPAAAAAVSWQLHQRLELQPGAGTVSVSVDPSVSVQLTDPRAPVLAEQLQLDAALTAIDEADQAARSALVLHGGFLSLQAAGWLLGALHGLQDLLQAEQSAAPQSATDLPALQLQVLQSDMSDHAAFQRLQLELAGLPGMTEPGRYWRPVAGLSTEPLPLCLANSRELRRLELLSSREETAGRLALAGRQPGVSLDLGVQLGVRLQPHGTQPQFGWSAGLRIARSDHAGPQLRFDASAHSLVQTFTVRGPGLSETEPAAATELNRAADQARLSLLALLQATDQAFRNELLERELASQAALKVEQQLARGVPDAEDVLALAQRLLTLVQSVVAHDQLLLQLAVECRFPVSWQEIAAYPWPD